MARQLSKLIVDLSLNSAEFNDKIDKAAKRSKFFGTETGGALIKLGAVAGAAFASYAAGAAVMVKNSISAMDSLDELSQRVGMTTEQLSQMAYAAQFSGIESQQFGNTMSVLSRNIAKAAGGNKTLQATFRALGVEVTDSNGKVRNTGDILYDVADAFASYEDGAAKSLAASTLFGRGIGGQMIPMLNGGSDALRKAAAESDAFGVTIGTETAAQAAQFSDQVDKLKSAASGFGNQLAEALLPTLVAVSEGMVAAAKDSKAFKAMLTATEVVVKSIVTAGVYVADIFQAVGKTVAAFAAHVTMLAKGDLKGAVEVLKASQLDIRATFAQSDAFIKQLWADAPAAADDSANEIKETIKKRLAIELPNELGGNTANPIEQLMTQLKEQASTLGMSSQQTEIWRLRQLGADAATLQLAQTMANKITLWEQDIAGIDAAIAAEEKYTEAMKTAADERAKNDEEFERMIGEQLFGIPKAADAGKKAWIDMTEVGKAAAANMQTAFADFLFDPFDKGLKGMLSGFVKVLRRMVAEAIAAKILQSFMGRFFPETTGVPASGASPSGKAVGGNVSAGVLYRVNEHDREYFKPAVAGSIVPLGGAGAAARPVVNINVHGANAQVEQRYEGGALNVDILVEQAFGRMVASGKFERQMAAANFPISRRGNR